MLLNPLSSYFAYVDVKLDLRKDCRFDSRVKKAHWDDNLHIWHVACDGKQGAYKAAARHLIICTVRLLYLLFIRLLTLTQGFASKPHTPKLKGLETFQGTWSHTGRWPKEGVETTGKRVGVIGTGASGVQVIQEIGRHVRMN